MPQSEAERADSPSRVVHHADALEWLRARDPVAGASAITSMPDVSELPELDLQRWQHWFTGAAELVCSRVGVGGVAIFFQTDVQHDGVWIDKAGLVAAGAQRAGMQLLQHGIVCRVAPDTACYGRAGYSHLLVYGRPDSTPPRALPHVDVLADAGFKPSSKSMGVRACAHACQIVVTRTATRTILDPFCGFGTVLAVANALSLDAIGVDLSRRMCQRARRLRLDASHLPDAEPMQAQ